MHKKIVLENHPSWSRFNRSIVRNCVLGKLFDMVSSFNVLQYNNDPGEIKRDTLSSGIIAPTIPHSDTYRKRENLTTAIN